MPRAAQLAVAILLGTTAVADAQDIAVRTSVQPSGAVKLGQPMQLLVDVLFPDDMPHPPRLAAPRVAGAQVFRFESQGTTMRERSGGHGLYRPALRIQHLSAPGRYADDTASAGDTARPCR